jgi:hypothetical protein
MKQAVSVSKVMESGCDEGVEMGGWGEREAKFCINFHEVIFY